MQFRKQSVIRAPAARVFAFHEEPDALDVLTPTWMPTRFVQRPTSLEVGTRVILELELGPFSYRIEAEHVAFEPGHMFRDRMVKGPFSKWIHTHRVEPEREGSCLLVDEVEYELPLGLLGTLLGGGVAGHQLERLFEFRHEVTRQRCEAPRGA